MTSRGRVAELRNAARQTLRPELAPPRRLGTICRFSNEIFSAMLVISIQSKYRYQRCFRLLHGLLRPKIKHVLSLPQPSLLRPGLVTSFAKPNQYGTKIQPRLSLHFLPNCFLVETRHRVHNYQYRYLLFVQSMFFVLSHICWILATSIV